MIERTKIYLVSLMNDSREGFISRLLKGLLRMLSWVYAVAVKFVDLSYKSSLRKKVKVGIPVVSVGNLTVGGTGKTPFTMYLAKMLAGKGYEVAVITRGYGSDEHLMLKEELPSAHVLVEQNRSKAAVEAERQGRNVIILDDGFQHRKLTRDLNILLVDAGEAFGNEKVLPRGLLREPVSAIKRADMVVITKCDKQSAAGLEVLRDKIKKKAGDIPMVYARHHLLKISDLNGHYRPAEDISGSKVVLLSAIADPWYFEFMVKHQGAIVLAHEKHTDHHRYSARGVKRLSEKGLDAGAEFILTTRKDLVKLRGIIPEKYRELFFAVEMKMDIIKGEESLVSGLASLGLGQDL